MAIQTPVVISTSGRAFGLPGRNTSSIRQVLVYGALALLVLVIGVVSGIYSDEPGYIGAVIGVLLVLPLIWNRPALGLYITIGGAFVFETFPLGFPDSITDDSAFFQTLRAVGGPRFLIFSGFEIIAVFTLVAVALRRISEKKIPLETGPLFAAISFYIAMVMFGFLNGVMRGGDVEAALWEIRTQVYLFVAYLIAVNTITNRKQLPIIFWVIIGSVALKGLIGSWRFLITLDGKLGGITSIARTSNSVMAHEESYLFALFFCFILILYLFRSHRGQLLVAILVMAPVVLAFLINQRRAGNLALMLGVAFILVMAFFLLRPQRKQLLIGCLLIAVITPIYFAATWNSKSIIAEPTRAVRSLVFPEGRDTTSNLSREIEALDLKYNIQGSPIIGRGYGRSIIFFIPIPAQNYDFYFWDIVPHNTILWVWMRLGVVGFSAFWFMSGRGIVHALLVAKNARDKYIQSTAIFGVISMLTWLLMATFDMGLVDFREMILVGAMMGIVSRLPYMPEYHGSNAVEADDEKDQALNAASGRPRTLRIGPG